MDGSPDQVRAGLARRAMGPKAMSSAPAAGWYPDPSDATGLDERYWTGSEWTDITRLAEGGTGGRSHRVPPVSGGSMASGGGGPATNPGQVLVSLGEIDCTATTVMTPNGNFPIRGTDWLIHDASTMTRRIPTYAIVLAIVFAMACLVGLLFLLIQEDEYTGSVSVTVRDRTGNYFATSIPVRGPGVVADVHARVNYCRHLADL